MLTQRPESWQDMSSDNILRWMLIGLLFAFFAAGFATIVKADEQDSMWAQMMEPSYKLYWKNQAICSATVIHSEANEEDEIETFLLTAAHCVKDEGMNVRKQTLDEKLDVVKETIFYAKKFRSFTDFDVAVLRILDKQESFPVAVIASEKTNIKAGRDVWAVGYPKALGITITHGEYTGKAKHPPTGKIFQRATASITGGNSGGGLFIKTPDGYQLFGVASGHFRDTSFMNYFSPLESIHRAVPKVHRTSLLRDF